MTELNLHTLKSGPKKKSKRLGRGNASGKGNYSARGLKGQRSRSGGRGGLKRRGLKQMLRSKPKLGGFKSLKPKLTTLTLDQMEKFFENGEMINSRVLFKRQLISSLKPGIKIVGNGQLTKKLTVTANAFSNSAKEAIIKAGGQAEIVSYPKANGKSVKSVKPVEKSAK